jgi:hypothetical protein
LGYGQQAFGKGQQLGQQAANAALGYGAQVGQQGLNAAKDVVQNMAQQGFDATQSLAQQIGLLKGPSLWQRGVNWLSGLASNAYNYVAAAFAPLMSSITSLIAAAPGWAFLVVPIAAGALYLYWRRYSERPESTPERLGGALIQKINEFQRYIGQLLQIIQSSPVLLQNYELQQAVGQSFPRFFNDLAQWNAAANAVTPDQEPPNAVDILAGLLATQSQINALVLKITPLLSQPSYVQPSYPQQQTSSYPQSLYTQSPPQLYPPYSTQQPTYATQQPSNPMFNPLLGQF